MNSVSAFAKHLGQEGRFLPEGDLDLVGRVDSVLLENGAVFGEDIPEVFYGKVGRLAWVVTRPNGCVYAVGGFDLSCGEMSVTLVEIVVGECFYREGRSYGFRLSTYAEEMQLANCPVGTFEWLKRNKATQKVIDRIKKAAQ